jgi:6-phosphogluconolactonase
MQAINCLKKVFAMAALATMGVAAPALAATYVYVSNADDGELTTYTMQGDGSLVAGPRVKVAGLVMPMAVSPDKRFLYAASRTAPFQLHAFAINPANGALTLLGSVPAAGSFPYISLDRTGRWLFAAGYGANLISVNAVGADGRIAPEASQVIPVGRNAHSIRVDETNRFVYTPTLGSDLVFQFTFDAKSGRLAANTPATILMKPVSGPRHFITSKDNKFVYLLSEMVGTVTTLSLDARTGLLSEVSSVSGVPPGSNLGPGLPRGAIGAPGGPPPRNTDKDIWVADIHMTPNGKYLYMSERTNSTIGAFSVNGDTGALKWISATNTEAGPRGFAIDAKGKYMVVTGEKSPTISVYAIEGDGNLKFLNKYPTGKDANWVEIVSFD